MDPWNWHPGTAPTRDQRVRVAGGPINLNDVSVERVQRVLRAYAPSPQKEIEIVRFRGHYYATAPAGIVSFDAPQFGARDQLPADLLVGAAGIAISGAAIDGMTWLDRYDAYYYDRDNHLSLPVLKHGAIARKEERLSRLNRWLYRGLHSLDFPLLYYRRPLWDVVVIVLSLGGLVLSATTLSASWRRVRGRCYFGVAILKG